MSIQHLEAFKVIGMAIRTSNEYGRAGQDIPALWNRFMTEGIVGKIPGKIDNTVYCMYTDYETDHTGPYTCILGCRVQNLDNIPVGMVGKVVEAAGYEKFIAKGNLLQGIVFKAWERIWNAGLKRTFTADFEVYGEKAQNPENAEVNIFIAVQYDESN